MKNLFYCHYELTVEDKKSPRGFYNERDCIAIMSEEEPSKAEIREAIQAEWKRKGIKNTDIYEIYTPEKVY